MRVLGKKQTEADHITHWNVRNMCNAYAAFLSGARIGTGLCLIVDQLYVRRPVCGIPMYHAVGSESMPNLRMPTLGALRDAAINAVCRELPWLDIAVLIGSTAQHND